MRSALTFIAKWALAGLAFALALVWMRPDLRSTAQQIAPAPITVFTPSKPTASPAPRVEYLVQSYADAVDKSAFAVVNIYAAVVVTQRSRQPDLENLFGDRWPSVQQRVEASLGSGVLWDAQGHVVTNNHVINNA